MFSGEKRISDINSDSFARMSSYASGVDKIAIFIPSKGKSFSIGNLSVFVSGTNNKIISFALMLFSSLYFILKEKRLKNTYAVTCQDPFFFGLLGFIVSKIFKLSLEIQVHTDLRFALDGDMLKRILAKLTLNTAKIVRTVSEKSKKSLIDFSPVCKNKTYVYPIAVYKKSFPKAVFNEKEKNILVVSRLESEKDVDKSLRIFRKILEIIPNANLRIAGSGSELDHLKHMTFKYGISDRVSFLGFVSDIFEEYKKSSILLHTSKYEGFGLVFVEAGSCGLPIVSTDVGIAKEVGAIILDDSEHVSSEIISVLTEKRIWTEKSKKVKNNSLQFIMDADEYSKGIVLKWKEFLI